MWGEPFSCSMKCPKCNSMMPHLIVLDTIYFKEQIILFEATCAECQRLSFLVNGEPTQPYLYKCDYAYWASIQPIEDDPCPN